MKKRILIPGLLAACAVAAALALGPRKVYTAAMQRVRGMKTVDDVLERYGSAARARLQGPFHKAGVDYPPAAVVLIGLKQERRLELWARNRSAIRSNGGSSSRTRCSRVVRATSTTNG